MSIRIAVFLVALVATLLLTPAVLAEDGAAAKPPSTEATPPSTTEPAGDAVLDGALPSRLQIHGYLSQAYARADQHQILGITKEGTAEYRLAALQFRYAMTGNDTFVLQIAHEKMGESPIEEEEIELDWGFYERRFGRGTRVKVGRVQMPFGIYNETRDVGTLLPFFRLPNNYYGEGAYETEAIDGAVVIHRFAADSPWSIEASAYYGGWDTLQVRETVAKAEMIDALGGQLWLSTPVDGLRFGLGALRVTETEGFLPKGVEHDQKTIHGSIDANFARFVVRGEYRHTNVEGGSSDKAMYGQVGVRVLPRLMVVVQADREKIHVPSMGPFMPAMDQTTGRDVALALNYFFRSDVVMKVEAHRNRHVAIEDGVPSFTNVPRADYAIVSLSVSF